MSLKSYPQTSRLARSLYNVRTWVTITIAAFLTTNILLILLLCRSASAAESGAVAPVTIKVETVLAMTTNTNNLSLSILPTPDGTLSTGEVDVDISTNNFTGYTLSMSTTTDNTALTHTNGTNSINSTSSPVSAPTALSSNTWGWYPSSLATNPGGSNYQFAAIPSLSSAYTLKSTDAMSTNDETTVSFGIMADTSIPAGSYSNTITFTAITNYVPQPTPIPEDAGVVDVYPTTGWAGDAIMITSNNQFNDVTGVTIGGTACTDYVIFSPSSIQCVLPAKAATNPSAGDGTENGYAVAVTTSTGTVDMHNFTVRYFNPSRTETIGSSTTSNITMQNFTQSNCNAMTVGQVVSLTDSRNNQTYRIKKMQDNKCWMVDNMKYLGEGITISNVDSTTGIIYNNESGKLNTVDGTFTQSTENSDKAFYNNPMSASYCYGTSIQSSYTKCGYLYNWYAATAGTGTYATSTEGTNVSGSICPTGWRLPSAYSDGSTATGNGTSSTAADFPVLNASMNAGSLTTGSTTSSYYANWLFTGAWSGVFSGYWGNGFGSQGSNGYYWSSTAYSSTYARNLSFSSSSVFPGNRSSSEFYGRAVRCVLP